MSLADRHRHIESNATAQQKEIDLLRTQMDKLLEVLAEEADADGEDEQHTGLTLDGVRPAGAGARDQSEPL